MSLIDKIDNLGEYLQIIGEFLLKQQVGDHSFALDVFVHGVKTDLNELLVFTRHAELPAILGVEALKYVLF